MEPTDLQTALENDITEVLLRYNHKCTLGEVVSVFGMFLSTMLAQVDKASQQSAIETVCFGLRSAVTMLGGDFPAATVAGPQSIN